MHANRGDQIVVETTTLAAARRPGEVPEVLGDGEREHYRVRWDNGHESVHFPGPHARVQPRGFAMRTRDVMTSPVITLRPDAPVQAAAALLCSHGFTSAPVVDAAGAVVGIASEADLMRGRIVPDGWVVPPEPDASVGEVMTPAPAAMRPEDDLADVVALMLEARTRSVPIIEDGKLVGIVTRRDVLRVVARRELTSDDVSRRRFEA